MIRFLVCLSFALIFNPVFCGNDLCENGLKIDSIAYISDRKEWFITSGGHYWHIKDIDLPPKVKGLPLPGGFITGNASVYRNSKTECNGKTSLEVYVYEKFDTLYYQVYDILTREWTSNATKYDSDPIIKRTRADPYKPLSAVFVFDKTNIIFVQMLVNNKTGNQTTYSAIDFAKTCKDPEVDGDAKSPQPITDLDISGDIDAATNLNNNTLLVIQGKEFFRITVRGNAFNKGTGKFDVQKIDKHSQQSVATDLLRYEKKCTLVVEGQTESSKETPEAPSDETPAQTSGSDEPEPEPQTEEAAESQPETTEESKKRSWLWIIIAVIVIILIIIAILFIICLVMRGKSSEDNPEDSKVDSTPGSKMNSMSSMGSSPSKMSVRSQTDLKPKSSVAPKASAAAKSTTPKSTTPKSMTPKSTTPKSTTSKSVASKK